jgi:transcriptional regulator with XRE-family HTH domain
MLFCMSRSTSEPIEFDLGAAIAEERRHRGMSQRQLGELVGHDSGWMSRIEANKRLPKLDDVARIAEVLELDADRAAELVRMAGETPKHSWLAITLPERRAQQRALLSVERTAKVVHHVAPLTIPGVLQTSDIIRSIMIAGGVPEDEIDERVSIRIGRRDLIARKNPAHLDVLLGEAAVRMVIGGPKIMADQLRYLLELMVLPNIVLRIVPFSAGWTPASAGAFILFESDTAPDRAHLETQTTGLLLTAREDIAAHRQAADAVREMAMSPNATKELIARVITELEKQHDDTK